MKTLAAHNEAELREILQWVHDRTFRIDDMLFDPEAHTLSIPLSVVDEEPMHHRRRFSIIHVWTNVIRYADLLFRKVQSVSLDDRARVGEADISTILFDGNEVTIKCGLPVTVRMKATELDVELRVSDTVVDTIDRFSLRPRRR